MIKRKEEWITYGKHHKKYLYFYEDKVLDLTQFMNQHPGGKKALANYTFKDITDTIYSVYPHKKESTQHVLLSYVVGKIPPIDTKNPKIERTATPNKDKQKKKVCFAKKFVSNSSEKEVSKQECATSVDSGAQPVPKEEGKKKKQKTKSKSKEKTSKHKEIKTKEEPPCTSLHSFTLLAEDFDQEKPQFRVPVLCIKHMEQLS